MRFLIFLRRQTLSDKTLNKFEFAEIFSQISNVAPGAETDSTRPSCRIRLGKEFPGAELESSQWPLPRGRVRMGKYLADAESDSA
jgi:hypothetical protein